MDRSFDNRKKRRRFERFLFLPLPIFGHVERLLPRTPLIMELLAKGSNELDGRVFVGEDPDHPFPSSDLFIQSLLGVRASEPDTIFPGKGQNRERFLKSFFEKIH